MTTSDRLRNPLRGHAATIVIPYYEQSEFIASALSSALAQTAGLVEVIIVDDGSSDDAARRLSAKHRDGGRPVRYLRVTNRGLPNARNVGLMNARGDAFVPLDADDWLDPTFLEKTLPLLDEFDVVVTGLQEHGVRNGTYDAGVDRPAEQVTVEAEWEANRFWYCSVYRTQLLRDVGGWNGRMVDGYADWDLWIDLLARGARVGGLNEVLFHYRTKPDSMHVAAHANHVKLIGEMRRHHNAPG